MQVHPCARAQHFWCLWINFSNLTFILIVWASSLCINNMLPFFFIVLSILVCIMGNLPSKVCTPSGKVCRKCVQESLCTWRIVDLGNISNEPLPGDCWKVICLITNTSEATPSRVCLGAGLDQHLCQHFLKGGGLRSYQMGSRLWLLQSKSSDCTCRKKRLKNTLICAPGLHLLTRYCHWLQHVKPWESGETVCGLDSTFSLSIIHRWVASAN